MAEQAYLQTVKKGKERGAQFKGTGSQFKVLFNPASLKVSLSNRLQDEDASGKDGQSRQNTRVTTTKLDTELIYDTTDTGGDVRDHTSKLKELAKATPGNPPAPPTVEFRWGRFSFIGVIESLNETLDFWAAEGIPLRATIQLVIQGLNGEADKIQPGEPAALNQIPAGGTGTTGAATTAGDPRAGRAIAALNGIENMRMAAGGAIAVSAGVSMKAAAGFSASAGAGISAGASAGARGGLGFGIGASAAAGASAGFGAGAGASAGFGASASAGFGASASAGFGAGASAGFGASASAGFGASASAGFGARASAGFSAGASASAFGASASSFSASSVSFGASATAGATASGGAFSGLGVSKTTSSSFRLDPSLLLPPRSAIVVGSATQFDLTGRAVSSGSSGLSANVGAVAGAGVRFS